MTTFNAYVNNSLKSHFIKILLIWEQSLVWVDQALGSHLWFPGESVAVEPLAVSQVDFIGSDLGDWNRNLIIMIRGSPRLSGQVSIRTSDSLTPILFPVPFRSFGWFPHPNFNFKLGTNILLLLILTDSSVDQLGFCSSTWPWSTYPSLTLTFRPSCLHLPHGGLTTVAAAPMMVSSCFRPWSWSPSTSFCIAPIVLWSLIKFRVISRED